MAGEIERPGDEDTRRHLIDKARERTQRRLDTGRGFHPHAQLTHGIRKLVHWHRMVAIRYLYRNDMARQPGEVGEKPVGILVAHHADDYDERPRYPLLEIAQGRRDNAP